MTFFNFRERITVPQFLFSLVLIAGGLFFLFYLSGLPSQANYFNTYWKLVLIAAFSFLGVSLAFFWSERKHFKMPPALMSSLGDFKDVVASKPLNLPMPLFAAIFGVAAIFFLQVTSTLHAFDLQQIGDAVTTLLVGFGSGLLEELIMAAFFMLWLVIFYVFGLFGGIAVLVALAYLVLPAGLGIPILIGLILLFLVDAFYTRKMTRRNFWVAGGAALLANGFIFASLHAADWLNHFFFRLLADSCNLATGGFACGLAMHVTNNASLVSNTGFWAFLAILIIGLVGVFWWISKRFKK